MIGAVRTWLMSVVTVSLLLAVAQALIPEGSIRKIASFTGGLVLLAALLQPVLQTDLGGLQLDLSDMTEEIRQRQESLTGDQAEELETIIARQTEAYISDKAADLGLAVTVRVETEAGEDGVPVPWSAEIDGDPSQPLADLMEQALGIPPERQVWHGQDEES